MKQRRLSKPIRIVAGLMCLLALALLVVYTLGKGNAFIPALILGTGVFVLWKWPKG